MKHNVSRKNLLISNPFVKDRKNCISLGMYYMVQFLLYPFIILAATEDILLSLVNPTYNM